MHYPDDDDADGFEAALYATVASITFAFPNDTFTYTLIRYATVGLVWAVIWRELFLIEDESTTDAPDEESRVMQLTHRLDKFVMWVAIASALYWFALVDEWMISLFDLPVTPLTLTGMIVVTLATVAFGLFVLKQAALETQMDILLAKLEQHRMEGDGGSQVLAEKVRDRVPEDRWANTPAINSDNPQASLVDFVEDDPDWKIDFRSEEEKREDRVQAAKDAHTVGRTILKYMVSIAFGTYLFGNILVSVGVVFAVFLSLFLLGTHLLAIKTRTFSTPYLTGVLFNATVLLVHVIVFSMV